MKKLHIKRIKLNFDETDSVELNFIETIKKEKELLKAKYPKNKIYEFKEMHTITDTYLVLVFKIMEPQGAQ
jgi:hypothetical protein